MTSNFKVYAYLPWPGVNTDESTLLRFGILPIYIIYENKYLTNGHIDAYKIKKLALDTLAKPNIPVSFDMEFGNRFKPETVIPLIKTILNQFRHYNSKSSVGLYAVIPQNTYGKIPINFSYESLNANYSHLIHWVDFISPSLYNYEKKKTRSWLNNARFVMDRAQQDALGKPILPYISPIIRLGPSFAAKNGNLVIELSEEEMTKRLQALYQLGAKGCIIWASSQDRTQEGQKLQFDSEAGWGKAVVNFNKSMREAHK